MEYLTKLAQNTPPTCTWSGVCKRIDVTCMGHFHNFRLFELSEDVYARSVPLVIIPCALRFPFSQRRTANENSASSFAFVDGFSFDCKEVFILLLRHLGRAGVWRPTIRKQLDSRVNNLVGHYTLGVNYLLLRSFPSVEALWTWQPTPALE